MKIQMMLTFFLLSSIASAQTQSLDSQFASAVTGFTGVSTSDSQGSPVVLLNGYSDGKKCQVVEISGPSHTEIKMNIEDGTWYELSANDGPLANCAPQSVTHEQTDSNFSLRMQASCKYASNGSWNSRRQLAIAKQDGTISSVSMKIKEGMSLSARILEGQDMANKFSVTCSR
jgi:hypothetical protein